MGRRGNGEGSIYQDKSGRWRGFVDLGYMNGKRKRKYVSGATKKAVAAKLVQVAQSRDAGQLPAIIERTPTLGEWMTFWLDNIARARVRPSTMRAYQGYVRNRIVPALGHHRLDRLQPEHLEAFYRESAKTLKPATVLQMHRVISRALKIAMRRGRVPRNVATLVDAPSVPHREVKPYSADEARRILLAAQGQRKAARWSVAFALGLRQGEALGLHWDSVDLDSETLTVRQALQRIPGQGLVLVPPKSVAGRRTVVLPKPLAEALRAHRAAQNAERLAAGRSWHETGFVFTTPIGTPLDPRNDYLAWRQLLRDAGVRHARLHDARHTAATLLLVQGVHPRVAMQILGHSQITLTLGTYSHVVPELQRDAANRMADALWPAGGDSGDNEDPKKIGCQLGCHDPGHMHERPVVVPLTRPNSVRRQGLEPRTRGLRVRCSAS
jgi:integrase